jgi:nitroreductase
MLVGVHNQRLVESIGKLNVACMDRSRLAGGYVSKEQPSIIDDPTIKSGFYGAPSMVVVFAQRNFLYSIPDAFCAAENMVLMATSLGISSCIIARGEETFTSEEGMEMLRKWEVPDNMVARCFVILGYHAGDYPAEKPRRAGREKIVE